MARGKYTCKILKEIRRQIAEANGIEFAIPECRYKGDCLGTCPKCEAEVRYLDEQLRSRSLAGKAVALAGISAGIIFISGCSSESVKNQSNPISHNDFQDTTLTSKCGEVKDITRIVENIETPNHSQTPMSKVDVVSDRDTGAVEIIQGEIFHDPDDPYILEGEVAPNRKTEISQIEVAQIEGDTFDEDLIYGSSVERMPQFPGGDTELLKFIYGNLNYPENTDGENVVRVVVQFYVDKLGYVRSPQILRATSPAFDEEALRVVNILPKFIPAEHGGKKVNVWYTIPIIFNYTEIEPVL